MCIRDSNNLSLNQKQNSIGVIPYPIIETTDGKVITLAKQSHLYTIDLSLNVKIPEAELINKENGVVKHYFPGSLVEMLPASNGHIWLNRNYLSKYNPSSKTTTKYPFPNEFSKFKSIVTGEKEPNMQFDESGKIWFVARNDRLFSFDTLTKLYKVFPEKEFPRGIVAIEHAKMWVVSDTFLYQFDENKKLEKSYTLPNEFITNSLSLIHI